MVSIHISKDTSGQITVTFPYDPLLADKVETIPGQRRHPDDKYWSFSILNKIIMENIRTTSDVNKLYEMLGQAKCRKNTCALRTRN
ncbi:MAG: hypothetical protein WC560_07870 [Syntrophales bacterium]